MVAPEEGVALMVTVPAPQRLAGVEAAIVGVTFTYAVISEPDNRYTML